MRFSKKTFFILTTLLLSLNFIFPAENNVAVKAPFTRGVNLTMWFESWSKSIPNLNLYNEQDFIDMKELGVDIIRLPIHFDMFVEDENNGTINSIIFEYLDLACDWAEKYQIHIVIDDHSFNSGPYPDAKGVREHSLSLWPQIAQRYRNRSEYIIYEILNEPRLTATEWYKIQEEILKLIRSYDTKHTIVVTGSDWGSLNALSKIKPYEDSNLIYTFHYYDPFVFTHQGASWSGKEIEALKDVPFPYDEKRIPKLTGAAANSWIAGNLRTNYKTDGTEAGMRKQLQKAVDFSQKYNVPVWCGEMGVYNLRAAYKDRVEWYKTTGKILQDLQIPFTVWGYGTSFGIFKKDSAEIYPYDLDKEIVKGLGFNTPAHIGEKIPDELNKITYPLTIYDDVVNKKANISNWDNSEKRIFLIADKSDAPQGKYNICWGNASRYASISFDLKRFDFSDFNKTYLDKTLSFYVKFENENQQVQIRFVDSDSEDGKQIPWRFAYNLTAKEVGTGRWIKYELPFAKMSVFGGWVNKLQKWYNKNPNDDFDWSRVETLQFTAEEDVIKDKIYLDHIQIK